jgi:hypothetical protein
MKDWHVIFSEFCATVKHYKIAKDAFEKYIFPLLLIVIGNV